MGFKVPDDAYVIERTGNGYRARRTSVAASRQEDAIRDWAAIAVLIVGLLAVLVLV